MTDKELADKAVALGVIKQYGTPPNTLVYWLGGIDLGAVDTAVRSWLVAGALMEKCPAVEIDTIGNPWWVVALRNVKPEQWFKAKGESLPRAIIEACVEALS